ncbi:MAG: P1 family peptidase [Coriobacteriia bacterium]|nr:P1 family peptidase [Coriobacteriia bacterium]MCL2750080.1 P1 family peptidase [Coriobacteriia bacterium]
MLIIESGSAAKLPQGILLGNTSDEEAATGCTVVLCKEGAVGSVAVRGAAPATRETDLLAPENAIQKVHAVVLSGGSAYGLDAASGVMNYLEEQDCGFPIGGAVVPIVVAAALFDLDIASASIRPNARMGYNAAATASPIIGATGNVGAGTGAAVGRFLGPLCSMKGGLGAASVESGSLLVSAVVAVNSLGNVYDREAGAYLAGALLEEDGKDSIVEPLEILPELFSAIADLRANTIIGAVLTNAKLSKPDAARVAAMAHDGLARAIYPAHTSFDGDALFALATGEVPSQQDAVGALAALAVERAIIDAVVSAKEAYGLPSALSLKK